MAVVLGRRVARSTTANGQPKGNNLGRFPKVVHRRPTPSTAPLKLCCPNFHLAAAATAEPQPHFPATSSRPLWHFLFLQTHRQQTPAGPQTASGPSWITNSAHEPASRGPVSVRRGPPVCALGRCIIHLASLGWRPRVGLCWQRFNGSSWPLQSDSARSLETR